MREFWIDPHYYETPECPVCGRQCDTIYKSNDNGEVVGCERCLSAVDSVEWEAEQEENDEELNGDSRFEAQRELNFERRNNG